MDSPKKGHALTIVKGSEKRKFTRKKVVISAIIIVVGISLTLFAVFYSNSKSYSSTYKNAVKALDESNYKKADSLLDSVKNDTEAKSSYKFYTLRAQAAYGLNNKETAKNYATTGIELYKKAKDKESGFGIILNDISTDTYAPEQSEGEQYKVPENQIKQEGFQG